MQVLFQFPHKRRGGIQVHYSRGELPRVGERVITRRDQWMVVNVEHWLGSKGQVTKIIVYLTEE